jgi:hypothetical protein
MRRHGADAQGSMRPRDARLLPTTGGGESHGRIDHPKEAVRASWSRFGKQPMRGTRARARRSVPAERARARHPTSARRMRRASTRPGIALTVSQPFAAIVPMLKGPCDPGTPGSCPPPAAGSPTVAWTIRRKPYGRHGQDRVSSCCGVRVRGGPTGARAQHPTGPRACAAGRSGRADRTRASHPTSAPRRGRVSAQPGIALTVSQLLAAMVRSSTGPCDPGSPCRPRIIRRRGVRGSHGPSAGSCKRLMTKNR